MCIRSMEIHSLGFVLLCGFFLSALQEGGSLMFELFFFCFGKETGIALFM